ncbi:MAG: organic solvent tolerance protein OstA, partial [Odoribacter sp.]|nr:organic solvent tolerance protein OstA [Odoribacter sp.]
MTRKALFLFICLSGIFGMAGAQKKAVIKIQHADFYKPEPALKRNKLIGNVKLTQNNMVMSCD